MEITKYTLFKIGKVQFFNEKDQNITDIFLSFKGFFNEGISSKFWYFLKVFWDCSEDFFVELDFQLKNHVGRIGK